MSYQSLRLSRQWFQPQLTDLIFPVATLLLVLATWFGVRADKPLILAGLISGVVLLGLPHGSLDPLVARKLWGKHRRFTMSQFLLGYVLLATACAAGWLTFPNAALVIFLIVSAIHFGTDWQDRGNRWGRAAYGFCVIAIPSLRYAAEVRQIFIALGATAVFSLVSALQVLACIAIPLALVSSFRPSERRNQDVLELAVIVASGLALPPLVFFICYFCLLHSPRHLYATSREVGLRSASAVLLAVAPIVLATLVLAALLWYFLPAKDVGSHILQIVFIGLAALTAPHMLLTTLNSA